MSIWKRKKKTLKKHLVKFFQQKVNIAVMRSGLAAKTNCIRLSEMHLMI